MTKSIIITSLIVLGLTTAEAAETDSVLGKIIQSDRGETISYRVAGKTQGGSEFEQGLLTSAINAKQQQTKKVEYQVKVRTVISAVPARSEFQNNLLQSATHGTTHESAEFARFTVVE